MTGRGGAVTLRSAGASADLIFTAVRLLAEAGAWMADSEAVGSGTSVGMGCSSSTAWVGVSAERLAVAWMGFEMEKPAQPPITALSEAAVIKALTPGAPPGALRLGVGLVFIAFLIDRDRFFYRRRG